MRPPVLVLQWFIETTPSGLPILVIVLGLEFIFFGVVDMAKSDVPIIDSMPPQERKMVSLCLALGFLFAALSLLQSNLSVYAVYLFLLFRTLEGAAAVLFYQKVAHVITNRSLPSSTRFKEKAKHLLLVFAIVAGGLGVAFHLLADASGTNFPWYQLAGVYTIVSFLLAILGVRWRLQPLSDDMNTPLIVGLALCIGGAEIFNYGSIFTEIAITGLGVLTYQAGFWAAVVIIGLHTVLPSTPTTDESQCSSCGDDLSEYQSPVYCPSCGHNIE